MIDGCYTNYNGPNFSKTIQQIFTEGTTIRIQYLKLVPMRSKLGYKMVRIFSAILVKRSGKTKTSMKFLWP